MTRGISKGLHVFCPCCFVCNLNLFQPQTTKYLHPPVLFFSDDLLWWKTQINWMWSALISFRVDHLWSSYSQTADTCNWSFGWAQCQAESYLWSNLGSHRISALSQGLCMSNRKKNNNNKGKMVVNTKFWIVLRDQAVFRVDHTLGFL